MKYEIENADGTWSQVTKAVFTAHTGNKREIPSFAPRGTVEGAKVSTGTKWLNIIAFNGNKANLDTLDLTDCLFVGEDTRKNPDGTPVTTYTENTGTGVWHRDFSNTREDNQQRKAEKKAQHEATVEATVLKGRGDTIVSIAVSANTLSPEAQVALINGMFASLKAKV